MNIVEVINKEVTARGMKLTVLANRSAVNVDLLSKSLRKKRKLKAEELIRLCRVLNLSLDDFKDDGPKHTG